ncbi:MAG: preprotein translocase subunit SecG [Candidatus Nealsonbacteria bacterium CG23_combo_of_CG06-09_8_20_14_all_40_13]|uniref:Protein-export membrane protein SecG n=1 Tax=Candidatus Nealsonbacteria bacterium CG23_combo_of_CG06-09_8_20_14_all_40_13 TaxID=1974724 RepID=A0A2G9YQP1_9BACT|nr:MAG: preprotein translocase subunit SecG [Candidatus Nealsonbacteria bacterium CG23_combo_of_CG06-09_8_20_14_all_40_13]PIR71073.1 MAG: preprotein translocase subunit SecG [Candidatus Nealsonbacteria bacterium CG10_big_fil_rev_8_21_14_0_10_40_24]PIU43305.1 MAG: preprotein translocase subunit SecG [Candidatus Nealsonbacteria bacterium CG07_land_8_20_14_0_80_40_10]
MGKILLVLQIIISFLLMASILLQQRGTTLGGAFGAESAIFRSRRGPERILFISTIVFAVCFVILALLSLLKDKFGWV